MLQNKQSRLGGSCQRPLNMSRHAVVIRAANHDNCVGTLRVYCDQSRSSCIIHLFNKTRIHVAFF